MPDRSCEFCTGPIVGRRSDARFCDDTCRRRAREAQERARMAVDPEFAERRAQWARESARRWHARHPDKAREKNARRDRSALRESAAAWQAAHPERVREHRRRAQARYQAAHPRVRADREARRRAAKRTATVEHVDRFRVWFIGAGACGICGDLVDVEEMHLDHIVPLARGGEHSYANVQAAHPPCNTAKGSR